MATSQHISHLDSLLELQKGFPKQNSNFGDTQVNWEYVRFVNSHPNPGNLRTQSSREFLKVERNWWFHYDHLTSHSPSWIFSLFSLARESVEVGMIWELFLKVLRKVFNPFSIDVFKCAVSFLAHAERFSCAGSWTDSWCHHWSMRIFRGSGIFVALLQTWVRGLRCWTEELPHRSHRF